jgi:hypothetical protein
VLFAIVLLVEGAVLFTSSSGIALLLNLSVPAWWYRGAHNTADCLMLDRLSAVHCARAATAHPAGAAQPQVDTRPGGIRDRHLGRGSGHRLMRPYRSSE